MSSQARADEEVEEEEEDAQPQPAKGAKKTRQGAVPEEEAEEAEEAEEDGDDDPLANFVDQPVDKQQASRISGLAQDWAQAKKNIHLPSYGPAKEIATSLAEFADGEKGDKVSPQCLYI